MVAHLGVITRKGQVTLPADIRRALNLQEGDTVAFRIEDGEVRVRPEAETRADPKGGVGRVRRMRPGGGQDFGALSGLGDSERAR